MVLCAQCASEVEPGSVCPSCGLYQESWGAGTAAPPPPPPTGWAPPPPQGAWAPPPSSPNAPQGTAWQQQARPDVSSKKITAGVCGILLGSLGVHKFVLGYTTEGLIMLLVTLLTCGLAGIVFGVIGLVEGIIYLTKSDDDFYRTYVAQKKGWF